MTKSEVSKRDAASAVVREPRPFLYLKPVRLPLRAENQCIDEFGLTRLEQAVSPSIGHLTRSLVNYTIARQNASSRGRAQPIQMSVLNRRRRAARSWLLAIAAGRIDGGTRHAVATQWLPLLCGTGPDLARVARPGQELIEFVRGAITACLFDESIDNLLPHARALHVLESTLAAHLAAVRQHAPRTARSLAAAR